MAKLDKHTRLEFLYKLRALFAEYNASVEVAESGYYYEGHLEIYINDTVNMVAELKHNFDLTVEEIDKAIEKIEKEK